MSILNSSVVAAACRVTPAYLPSVHLNWPVLCIALAQRGFDTGSAEVAMAANVAVETAYTFRPLTEYASGAAYDTGPEAIRLGNTPTADGDGEKYKGRGFLQITGKANYAHYGNQLDVDLVGTPERALDPTVSAKIAALYFQEHTIPTLAAAGNWEGVRRAVNGGLNNYSEFKAIVDVLLTYLPDVPAPEAPAFHILTRGLPQ